MIQVKQNDCSFPLINVQLSETEKSLIYQVDDEEIAILIF